MRKGNPISMWWETEIRWCIFFFKAFKLNRTIVGYYHLGSAVAVTVLSLEAHCTTVIPISFVCFRRFLFPFLSLCHFFLSINHEQVFTYTTRHRARCPHLSPRELWTLWPLWPMASVLNLSVRAGWPVPSTDTADVIHLPRRSTTARLSSLNIQEIE